MAKEMAKMELEMKKLDIVEEEHCGVTMTKNFEYSLHCVLPGDIIFSIIMKIPSKYILKFKSVCKSWNALISDSSFTNAFLHPQYDTPFFFVFHKTLRNRWFHLSKFQPGEKETILLETRKVDRDYIFLLPSVNGLVCLIGDTKFHICNPTTEHKRTYPMLEELGPEPSLRSFGFGFDKSKGEYKLVQVYNDPEEIIEMPDTPLASMKCAILTIGTKSAWRRIKAPDYPLNQALNQQSVYVDGRIYWLLEKYSNGVEVVAFNVHDETFFRLASLPPIARDGYILFTRLVELNGRLCKVRVLGDKLDVWMLKDGDHDWARAYEIAIDAEELYKRATLMPQWIIGNEEKVIIESENYGLLLYDIKTKLIENIYNERKQSGYLITDYVPSLVSLDM